MEQKIIYPEKNFKMFDDWIREIDCKRIFLVCDNSLSYQKEFTNHLDKLKKLGVEIIVFQNIQPNPLYENVQQGVSLYREMKCDTIIAVGGGSAIDVAKCVKLYSNSPGNGDQGVWLNSKPEYNNTPFLAMPTTAGTGSEATRYAVIYYKGKKQSITNEILIPQAVLMDANSLITLPVYQKKATMMDTLCHSLESFWSVNSTDESKEYSRKAIELVMDNLMGYLDNKETNRKNMLLAANFAGKAINITQTTAGHAMCYKITSLFGIAHGHAAILCDRVLFPWMIKNTEKCIDPRGEKHLKKTFNELGKAMGCANAETGAVKLNALFNKLEFDIPHATDEQFVELKTSVNTERLKNHPISLDIDTIDILYHKILNGR